MLLVERSVISVDTVALMPKPLHEVMSDVLREFGGVMYSEDLARVIVERDLYRRDDGAHPPARQLRARAVQYPDLLEASGDGTGRIALARRSVDDQLDRLVVFCADVGSVKSGNFGWARSLGPQPAEEQHDESRPSHLAAAVTKELERRNPVALGFECPLFVPVPDEEMALGRARVGEGNRSWSAGAGTGALATGLVQYAWVLRALRQSRPTDDLFFDWPSFVAARRGLFIWEAFVSAESKGDSHQDDAAIAVAAFERSLPDPTSSTAVTAENPLSLIGAAAFWAGWRIDAEALSAPLVVLRA